MTSLESRFISPEGTNFFRLSGRAYLGILVSRYSESEICAKIPTNLISTYQGTRGSAEVRVQCFRILVGSSSSHISTADLKTSFSQQKYEGYYLFIFILF